MFLRLIRDWTVAQVHGGAADLDQPLWAVLQELLGELDMEGVLIQA